MHDVIGVIVYVSKMFVTVWSAQTRQASIRSFLMRNGLEVGTWLRFNARYEPILHRYDYLISEYDIIPAHLVTRINENNEVMVCFSHFACLYIINKIISVLFEFATTSDANCAA